MTQANILPRKNFHLSRLAKRMLIGAGIGLLIISFFVFGNDKGKPEWGAYWMIRPLLMGPFAGAMGGFVFNLLEPLRQGGWRTLMANMLGVLIFLIGMWMGIILGLSGTMWD